MAHPKLQPRIRAYLETKDGMVSDIAAALGLQPRQVTQAIRDMKGVYPVDRRGKNIVWSVNPPKPRNKNLPMPYKPEFRPLTPADYDLWAHRDMPRR